MRNCAFLNGIFGNFAHFLVFFTLICDRGAEIDREGEGKTTALQRASYKGSLSIVDILLRRGANVNLGKSAALHQARKRGHVAVIDLLLKSGADDSIRDRGGHTDTIIAPIMTYQRKFSNMNNSLRHTYSRFLIFILKLFIEHIHGIITLNPSTETSIYKHHFCASH